jgi:hypothetical protein
MSQKVVEVLNSPKKRKAMKGRAGKGGTDGFTTVSCAKADRLAQRRAACRPSR